MNVKELWDTLTMAPGLAHVIVYDAAAGAHRVVVGIRQRGEGSTCVVELQLEPWPRVPKPQPIAPAASSAARAAWTEPDAAGNCPQTKQRCKTPRNCMAHSCEDQPL